VNQQPPPPAGWGTPPPPRPSRVNGLPWYQRWWWAVALAAFLLGGAFAGASQPEPEPEIRTVTQVSERPVWTPECEEIPNQSQRRQCEGIMAGYNRSLQPATTTTVASTTATTRRPQAGDDHDPPASAGDHPATGAELSPLVPGLLYPHRLHQTWIAMRSTAATSRSWHPTRTGSTARATAWVARARTVSRSFAMTQSLATTLR
jgi:hypothetical protein